MTRRLVLSYLAVTFLVVLALEVPLGITYTHRQRDYLAREVERDAFALSSFAEDTLEGREQTDLTRLAERYASTTGARVVIVDRDGKAVADTDPPKPGERSFADRPELQQALQGRVATGSRYSKTLGHGFVYVAVPSASGGIVHGAVRITFPTSTVDARVRRYWLTLAAVAVVSLAAAGAVGALLARSVSRPLARVEGAATAMGAGDLAVRVPDDTGPAEVRALAGAFNETAARLEELVSAQEQFVGDASHQLRTPLTALRLRLENLETEIGPDAADDLRAAEAEVARLSRLVDGLLALARADRVAASATAGPTRVADLLEERRATWDPVAAERDVDLRVDVQGDPVARATRDRVTQALDNLIANALEVAPPGSSVTLAGQASRLGVTAELHVVDHGPGLTAEQRERAFDRFWRATSAGGSLGGSGLGLAIVRKLVRADGGEVELLEADGGGLDAVIRLPLVQA